MIIRRIATVIVVWCLLGAFAPAWVEPARAFIPPPTGPHLLRNLQTGTCLAIDEAAAGSDHIAVLTSCQSAVDRSFTITSSTNLAAPHVLRLANGVCLDNYHDSGSLGAKVVGWGCNPNDSAQQWTINQSEYDYYFTIVSRRGTCLEPNGANQVVLQSCWGGISRYWQYLPSSQPTAPLLAQLASPWCAAIVSVTVHLGSCEYLIDRRWFMIPDNNTGSTFRLATADSRCLTVRDSSLDNGKPIDGVPCNSANAFQVWTRTVTTRGLGLRNVASSKCLDTMDARTAFGSQVVQGTCSMSDSQTWFFFD
jgi:hypothetical protein